MKRLAVVACVALGSALWACQGDSTSGEQQALLESWVDDVILPLYARFETRAAALDTAASSLCDAPSGETLGEARKAWRAARAPWKQAEVFNFGPQMALRTQIDFWPARESTIVGVLDGQDAIEINLLGAPAKGFSAIEFLLFEPDLNVRQAFEDDARRCRYLQVITADLSARAAELHAAWDPAEGNYAAELSEPGAGADMFESPHEALSEIVNRMAFTVENMRADKLGRPLGTDSGGTPQPTTVESQFSGRSVQDMRDNLRGLQQLYFGDQGDAGGGSLNAYQRARGHDFEASVRAQFDASEQALDAIADPLTETIWVDPDAVSDAIDTLGDLQRLIQVDLIGALSLTASFNDNDGD